MGKYLVIANYTPEGMKGVLDKGGTSRRAALEAACAKAGGSLESFYFAFGADDAYVTVDMPDNVSVAALVSRVATTGLTSTRTVVLLTPEEMDAAAGKEVVYAAPGT
jgi:uncharacterized protein with GYD domain